MSYEKRNTSYLVMGGISSGAFAALILLGQQQNWTAETYAQVIGSFATSLSIIFLVVDKIMFDRPHFTLINVRDISYSNIGKRTDSMIFLFQNDGFRDSSSVLVYGHILSNRFKIKKMFNLPLKSMTQEAAVENRGIAVKVGEQFEGFLKKSFFEYKNDGQTLRSGILRLRLFAAFAPERKYYRYRWKDDELIIEPVHRIKHLYYDGVFVLVNEVPGSRLQNWVQTSYKDS